MLVLQFCFAIAAIITLHAVQAELNNYAAAAAASAVTDIGNQLQKPALPLQNQFVMPYYPYQALMQAYQNLQQPAAASVKPQEPPQTVREIDLSDVLGQKTTQTNLSQQPEQQRQPQQQQISLSPAAIPPAVPVLQPHFHLPPNLPIASQVPLPM